MKTMEMDNRGDTKMARMKKSTGRSAKKMTRKHMKIKGRS
jgi:hypothetical protein